MTRDTSHRLTGLEHYARQSRLAMEADVKPDTKTHKRTEDAAANRAKHGDSCSAKRVNTYGPTSSTNFGMNAESPALSLRDDALVGKGAAASKPCLSPVEMRTQTATSGLFFAGTASTAMRTIIYRPLPSSIFGENIKERTSRTKNQLAPLCARMGIQIK